MSHTIVNLIRRLPIKNPAKAVLWVIADIADDKGYAYPSIDTIALESGCSRSTVIRAIAQLESMNVVSANRKNGRHTTYTVTPESFKNQCQSDTSVRVTPVSERHATSVSVTQGGCQSDTKPVSERHTNPHKPPYNPQGTPSVVLAQESDALDTKPVKKSKPEKTGVSVDQVMELITGISEQAAKDLIAHRLKDKKASFTVTALKIMSKQMLTSAQEHNLPIDDVVGEFLTTTWTGFRSDWFTNRIKSNASKNPSAGAGSKWQTWQQEQDDKWAGLKDLAEGRTSPKTVSGEDNLIEFLGVRHA